MRPKFCILSICRPCKNCAHELTLNPTNSTSNKFSGAPRGNQNHQRISKNKLTDGYRNRLSRSRAVVTNVEFFPDFLFVVSTASTPPVKKSIAWTERQNRLYKPHACHRGDASAQRAAPGRAEFSGVCSSERVVAAKRLHFEDFPTMQKSRPRTDLDGRKFDVKQIFWSTARQPKPPAHIKEQTDGRISKTIVGIQSSDHKRGNFPGFSVRHVGCFDAPGPE